MGPRGFAGAGVTLGGRRKRGLVMHHATERRVGSTGLRGFYPARVNATSNADAGKATIQRTARPTGAVSLLGRRQTSPIIVVGRPDSGNTVNYELRLGFDIPTPGSPDGPGPAEATIAGCIDWLVASGAVEVGTAVIDGLASQKPFQLGDYLSKDISLTLATRYAAWQAASLGNTGLVPQLFEKASGSGSGDVDAVECLGWGDIGNASYLLLVLWSSEVDDLQALGALGD